MLGSRKFPSAFWVEIVKDHGIRGILVCPELTEKDGRIVERCPICANGVAINKSIGVKIACGAINLVATGAKLERFIRISR